ncbi:MAG: hypothetical protein ONB05_12160, partial [candidate division KSB1 bacterium]|nr:hypothetical protein [candidate division KSB1 bacterium]
MARIKEKHLQPFKEAYNNFVPKPLYTKDQLDRFYSGHASGIAKEFIAWLKMNPDPYKFLVTGHAGCGKTTELFKMAFQMEKDFNIIYCSAFEIMDKNDPDYKDILLLMCARLHQFAERLSSEKQLSQSDLSEIRGLYRPFHDFIKKNV